MPAGYGPGRVQCRSGTAVETRHVPTVRAELGFCCRSDEGSAKLLRNVDPYKSHTA
jgi:hypothetical protein